MSRAHSKYRPYFSAPELVEIIASLKKTSTNIPLIRYLEDFSLKISRDILTPQHIPVHKETMEEKLGFTTTQSAPTGTITISLTQQKKDAYDKWQSNPSQCTPTEIKLSFEYRYENNLLTTEEQISFEESLYLSVVKN